MFIRLIIAAGGYGEEDWENLDRLNPMLLKKFNKAVIKNSYKSD
jgi:hypothetical protein